MTEDGSCPNCGAGPDDQDLIGPCLCCNVCGHEYGFPGMIAPDELMHLPKTHPLRKRKTDPRDPHPEDVKRDELKAEAKVTCRRRGHQMLGWREDWPASVCVCRRCGRNATVAPSPGPNETEIGGAAVTADCEVER